MFAAFERELNIHRDSGYHRLGGLLQRGDVDAGFRERALTPPAAYLDFLCMVGPGVFFGGALTIYPLSSDRWRSVESELARLRKVSTEAIFPFGYDGTTESRRCFEATSGKDQVYWFSWEEKAKRSFSAGFREWIEECYAFDPFNVPFTSIEVKFNPVIDLGSKMRARFKELSDLLA